MLLMAFSSSLLMEGERAIHSREFILSLWTSTASVVLHSIPKELCMPIRKTQKTGRRGGLCHRIKTLWLENLNANSSKLVFSLSLRPGSVRIETWTRKWSWAALESLYAWTDHRRSPRRVKVAECVFMSTKIIARLVMREKIYTADLELLTVSLRPFYLPCEFQQLFFTVVYIHPHANVSAAT